MHNPGGLEGVAAFLKTFPAIETGRIALCVESNVRQAAGRGQLQQLCQQCATHALPTPRRQHGHPADTALRRQPSGSHGLARIAAGQYVAAVRIQTIPFQRLGNALFNDEYRVTHGPDRGLVIAPVRLAYAAVRPGGHA